MINLTHKDLWRLLNACEENQYNFRDIIAFYVIENHDNNIIERMVLPPISTSEGLIIIGLNRKTNGTCVLLHPEKHTCLLYDSRPIACRNYPFSFTVSSEKSSIPTVSFVEGSRSNCKGLLSKEISLDDQELIDEGRRTLKDIERFKDICHEIQLESERTDLLSINEILSILILVGENESKISSDC